MIRKVKHKSTDMRCQIIQMVLLIAMMLCFAFMQSKERVLEPASPIALYESGQDISSGYIYKDCDF